MRPTLFLASCLSALTATVAAQSNASDTLISKQILPHNFKPPQVFKNANLVRNVNLDKSYARETINVIIENVDKKPQDEYYLPFEAETLARIGGLEVRDKKDTASGPFEVQVVGFDPSSTTEFFKIKLPKPLGSSKQQTLSISYNVLSPLNPLPKQINQLDKQYVKYDFSAYVPSAYLTQKQKTKIKFPTGDIPDYTKLEAKNADGQADPQKQGSTITYGPYNDIPAGAEEFVTVRYEFTKPLLHATLLQRDYEVSHWGGNLATEERYWLTNRGASLKTQFSRVGWQMAQYSRPPTSALRELNYPLRIGSTNPYFIDDIGNVSTSRFRSNVKEAHLELKPRYPVFGAWNYKFRVGWDGNLKDYLRKLKSGETYVLKVPFLEGPKMPEGIEYKRVEVRVVLPEGAQNIKHNLNAPINIISSELKTHNTFMDTLGRPTLELVAINLSDDVRDRADLYITYDYPSMALFRKPLTIVAAMLSLFVGAWVIGSIDVSIGRKTVIPGVQKR